MAESSEEFSKESKMLGPEDRLDLQALESRLKEGITVREDQIAKLKAHMDKSAITVNSKLIELLSAFQIHLSVLTKEVYDLKKQVDTLKEAEG